MRILLILFLLASPVFAGVERLRGVDETIEIVIDGKTYTETKEIGEVILATTNREPKRTYIRLQHYIGDSWLWNAPIDDYIAENTSLDTDRETRWVKE